ncbi:SGNH/GDSL hydrolase family protein [Paenibacillus alginolyticus]|uniref:SGNH/GDSL hydrolase family protein n=1 Tax=Paenibacillus alginolyticus TaxID=59839 RepID=A0ABT4G7W4_9BACL|nr:SGNH/GDSL hydrolase family protein [Paenibacillus alginolyticus]MCY9692282.1 SGNH/GDSL hydrolase family protein [Paenibacillus alginolyticus]MEC0145877.1 SGNH/GDSL hydrolase family protein [Paenibacillus alginolyticus]
MIYTALGDSITFGEDASSLRKAYTQLTVSTLNSRSRRVTGYVLARPGWSSYDLLDAVIWEGASMIRQSAVVSIWIGGVDLANAALFSLRSQQPLNAKQIATSYKRNLSAILSQIKNCSHARIICCTQYNPFPNSPLAIESIDRLNHLTNELAQSYDATIAPAHSWFEGKQADLIYGYQKGKIEDALSGSLPIHPNDRGHQVIAMGLAPYIIPRK